MLKTAINRYATPFTTGLFLSSLISGTLIFFHLGGGELHGMHEWLSMVLILPFIFHVWKNWISLVNYMRRGWLAIPLLLSLAASVAFYAPGYLLPASQSGRGGGNPAIALAGKLAGAKLADLGPVLQTSPAALTQALTDKGFVVASADATLEEIGKASGKSGRDAVMALAAMR